MKKTKMTPAQRAVLGKLQRDSLFCEDVSRCEPLFWISHCGRSRTRGPGWHTVEAMERRGWVRVVRMPAFGRWELFIRALVRPADLEAERLGIG